MAEKTQKTIFETLSLIDISKGVEKRKNGSVELAYLSWSYAWGEVKTLYPTANYKVKEYDGKPYLFDENLGYLVGTSVTINGETIEMHLPVMDGANKAQKHTQYSYTTKLGVKKVEPATMFDINTAIMRCFVKNIAMFGLGLSLYFGEDLPSIKELKQEIQTEGIVLNVIYKLENKQLTDIEKVKSWVEASKDKISKENLEKINNLLKSYE